MNSPTSLGQLRALKAAAVEVLRRNDLGGATSASPGLYTHQWSWDSAFVAIGLAHLSPARAVAELRTLLDAQWPDGRIPHIVYNPRADASGDFADSEPWRVRQPGSATETSGLVQPPVHAIAAVAALRRAIAAGDAQAEAAAVGLYPDLLRWHRYLIDQRDPTGSGLLTIYHPWESGWDNSPRWDEALQAVAADEVPRYSRRDVAHTGDASQRPTDAHYDRYMVLLASLRDAGYDDEAVRAGHPFLATDVMSTAILVAANTALAQLAAHAGADPAQTAALGQWSERARAALAAATDPATGLCLDSDAVTGRPLTARTAAGLAPLVAGGLEGAALEDMLALLDSGAFCGHPGLRWPLPPSTSPTDPRFEPRGYWRGPVWAVVVWLVEWSLRRAGERKHAARMRAAALDMVAASGFAEYVQPSTGEPLGSRDQAWTAAVTLDWLAVQAHKTG